MTREEAIRQIEGRWSIMDYSESEALGEALDMAIEALSQPEEELIIQTGQTWGKSANLISSANFISRQGALAKVRTRLQDWAAYGNEEYRRGLYACEDVILSLPSADAVQVVRCKDCRHRYEEGDCTHYYWCRLNDRPIDDTDFCAWGERRGGVDE